MLDIKFIRENKDKVKKNCQKRGCNIDIDRLLLVDEEKRNKLRKVEEINSQKNKATKIIPKITDESEKKKLISQMQKLDKESDKLENELKVFSVEFDDLISQVPNLVFDDVPIGDESKNVIIREAGKKPNFNFEPKDYLEIAQNLDLVHIKRASKVSGSRFNYLKRELVLMEFALVNLAFDVLTKKGFVLIIPPVLIKSEMMKAMGYIDSKEDLAERYFLEKDDLFLVGTSEQSIGPMHAGEIFEEKDLPKRYAAFSTCFREEAGSYGKDTKGILRVHQFDKVEMFVFSKPEESEKEHQLVISLEEELMKLLKLPYRVVQLASADLAWPSASTYDIETWMPGQKEYRETHSASNCADFQARRLNIRYRKVKDNKIHYVHMLNGTAFAIGRMLIAIIENYQQKDGSIKIPEVLRKYLPFRKIR